MSKKKIKYYNLEQINYNKIDIYQSNFEYYVKEPILENNKIQWDIIEMIHYKSKELITCPICLEIPVVPKITKCGHIYCSSCLYKYLSIDQDCPICKKTIEYNQLKSVIIEKIYKYEIGDEIEFELLERYNHCLYPQKKDSNENTMEYSRYHLMKQEYINKELETLGFLEVDSENEFYISMTKDEILKRKKLFKEKEIQLNINKNEKVYYYYTNQQYYYLSSLDSKILLYHSNHCNHDLDLKLKVKIENIYHYILDFETRKQFPYLSHLPLGFEFCVLDVDLQFVVDEKCFEKFKREIKERRDEKRRRDEKERREREEIERKENQEREKRIRENEMRLKEIEILNDMKLFPSIEGSKDVINQNKEWIKKKKDDFPSLTNVVVQQQDFGVWGKKEKKEKNQQNVVIIQQDIGVWGEKKEKNQQNVVNQQNLGEWGGNITKKEKKKKEDFPKLK